jgi:hypothetical protein
MRTERPLSGLLVQEPVLSPTRITPENKGKIRPQPDRENAFARASGGGNATAVEPSLAFISLRLLSCFPKLVAEDAITQAR